MKLADCQTIDDLRLLAKRRAHRMVFDYIDGGADTETTLRENSSAFDKHRFRHRILRDVSQIDTTATLLGKPMRTPILCSPTAGNRLFHTDGETAVAKAAGAAGVVCGLSTLGSTSIEDFAATGGGPKWFQCYVWKDRGLTRAMLDRARAAGLEALVLTVDMPVHGHRRRDHRNGFSIPPKIGPQQVWEAIKRPRWTADYLRSPAIRYANLDTATPATSLADFVNAQLDPSFDWADAEALIADWQGDVIIKGIVHPDDAKHAVAIGARAVSVSNHGGRQLDSDIAAIDALPAIVAAIGGEANIILDGGVRDGADILKAMALGADAVGVGRAYLYGLAAGGEAGVAKALAILDDGLRRSMALAGIATLQDAPSTLA